jgi:branched-chain amino acid transport system permease protein
VQKKVLFILRYQGERILAKAMAQWKGREMEMVKPVRSQFVIPAIAFALMVWPLLISGSGLHYRVMGMACFYGALALSWNIFALTGAISLGHAAFFGLGAYGSALLSHYWHWSPHFTIFLGGAIGGIYGVVWHVTFRRLRGAAFALATLASVEIPKVIIDNWDSLTSGSLGLVGIASLTSAGLLSMGMESGEGLQTQYYLLLLGALVVACIHAGAVSSKWGWAIRAVREDEVAASTLGLNVPRIRLLTLSLSAFLTGLCGAVYAHLMGFIEPALVFSLHFSALPLMLSIFGGRYQAFGPFLGALIIYPVDQLMFHSWLPAGHGALYGLVMVFSILFFPHGIGEWVQEKAKSV